MSESTPRHGLALLVQGQGQKDMTHNEALMRLDVLLHPLVEEFLRPAPPTSPSIGQMWLIGDDAEGAWQGHGGELGIWTAGGWRFVPAVEGMSVTERSMERWRKGTDGWHRELPRPAPAVALVPPDGGAVVDIEARATLAAIIVRMQLFGLLA